MHWTPLHTDFILDSIRLLWKDNSSITSCYLTTMRSYSVVTQVPEDVRPVEKMISMKVLNLVGLIFACQLSGSAFFISQLVNLMGTQFPVFLWYESIEAEFTVIPLKAMWEVVFSDLRTRSYNLQAWLRKSALQKWRQLIQLNGKTKHMTEN